MLAAITAAILLMLVIHQSRLTSWMSAETDVLVRADRCEFLADSAIQEATARFRVEANDPSSALYTKLREEVFAPGLGDFVPPTSLQTPHTAALLSSNDLRGFELSSVGVRVALQRQLDTTSYERYGLVRYRASATSPANLGRAAYRRVETVQSFKVALCSVPHPYCNYGIFVGDAFSVTDSEAVNLARDKLASALVAIWGHVDWARVQAPTVQTPLYDQLNELLVPKTSIDRAEPLPTASRAALYGLLYEGLEMDLKVLDLATDLQNSLAKIAEKAGPLNAAVSAIQATPSSKVAHESFVEAALTSGKLVGEALWNIWAFNQSFVILPSSHESYPSIEHHSAKLNGGYWFRRRQFRVSPRSSADANCAKAWGAFLEDFPSPRGVIHIENQTSPFILSGRVPGRAVIVTGYGGVHVKDFNIGETDDDCMTVVSLGGPVTISGENHCWVILANAPSDGARTLCFNSGSILEGGMTMGRLPSGARLDGLLRRREKYYSGRTTPKGRLYLDPEALFCAFSPRPVYRKVSRK